MANYRGRMITPTTTDLSSPNILITPHIHNLTFSALPTDKTGIVLSNPNSLGINDKLDAVINQYAPEMVQLTASGGCSSDLTMTVPREMIRSMYDMLNVKNNNCLPETQIFMQTLIGYLNAALTGPITLPRTFWTQLGRVAKELSVKEATVNTSAAAMRSMSMAIHTDSQSIPKNNMLLTTISSLNALRTQQITPIDQEFEDNFSEYVQPQPEPNDVMNEVIDQVPTTIGENSTTPPSNIVNVSVSDAAENVALYDFDDPTTLGAQAYSGLKRIFATKLLTVPINHLKITHGGTITVVQPETTTLLVDAHLDGTELVKDFREFTFMRKVVISLTDLDLNKSLLEQDWTFMPVNGELTNGAKWISCYDLVHSPQLLSFNGPISFKGVNSKKIYTLQEARAIGAALSSLWNKITSMELPSPEHIQMGVSILAAGFGVAGEIFGSSGLITASKAVASLASGLGAFISNLKPTTGLDPTPAASLPKNALSTIPGAIEAGKSVYEKISISAQNQRSNLSRISKQIDAEYTLSGLALQSAVHVRRSKNIFT